MCGKWTYYQCQPTKRQIKDARPRRSEQIYSFLSTNVSIVRMRHRPVQKPNQLIIEHIFHSWFTLICTLVCSSDGMAMSEPHWPQSSSRMIWQHTYTFRYTRRITLNIISMSISCKIKFLTLLYCLFVHKLPSHIIEKFLMERFVRKIVQFVVAGMVVVLVVVGWFTMLYNN